MTPKETEIIDLLLKAAERGTNHMAHWDSEGTRGMNCPVCNDVRDMIQMAKRLMEES